ncbi:MAG: YraN family protein [Candidatus Omnitrophota bacterium]
MRTKIDIGRRAEGRAARHLRQHGYRILEQNFKNKLGEIDIVAKDKDVICFVEVRSRRGLREHQEVLASVDGRKQRRLSTMAVSFLKQRRLLEQKARFDIVSVIFDQDREDIRLLKDAFPLCSRYSF